MTNLLARLQEPFHVSRKSLFSFLCNGDSLWPECGKENFELLWCCRSIMKRNIRAGNCNSVCITQRHSKKTASRSIARVIGSFSYENFHDVMMRNIFCAQSLEAETITFLCVLATRALSSTRECVNCKKYTHFAEFCAATHSRSSWWFSGIYEATSDDEIVSFFSHFLHLSSAFWVWVRMKLNITRFIIKKRVPSRTSTVVRPQRRQRAQTAQNDDVTGSRTVRRW